ncbi:DUF3800 domain-containing protein [Rhizobium ruizarguesonis]|uniref:DUF3800 domain-containing protein n=1 Tax=Rhizobium ruizarguesonis TaxID=2081791 RepID=UPI00144665E5|nr:hypothetical protein [Rhizobium ruizarguesonis]
MGWHAYIDESYSPDKDAYVIGGCISTKEEWASFSTEWQSYLSRFGRVDESGLRYFHMQEMAYNLEEVGFFYCVMQLYVAAYISVRFNKSDFERAMRRIYIPGKIVEWDRPNYYWIAFRCLLDKFHLEREKLADLIPLDETVQFHMDQISSGKVVDKLWPEYMQNRSDMMRERYAGIPTFESDKNSLPLQAADLWVWWVRKWCDLNQTHRITAHDFDGFAKSAKRRTPRVTVDISFSEDEFLPTMERWAKSQSGGNHVMVLPRGAAEFDLPQFSSQSHFSIARYP